MTQETSVLELKQPELEIHLPETVVDNPSIPMRWCLSREMHGRIINGLKSGYGYGILLVAKLDGDSMGAHEVREVKDPLMLFTFLTLPKPGRWSVGLFLFERLKLAEWEATSHALQQGLVTKYRTRPVTPTLPRCFTESLPSLSDIKVRPDYESNERSLGLGSNSGALIALHVIGVELPKEIFAAEPSAAVRAFANYFLPRSPPMDECAFRRRLLVMSFGGFIPYLIIELLKRAGVFIVSVVALLLCFKISLKGMLHAFAPAVSHDFEIPVEEDAKGNSRSISPLFQGWGRLLSPGGLVGIVAVSWILYNVVVNTLIPALNDSWVWFANTSWAIIVAGIVVVVLLLGAVFSYISGLIKKRRANYDYVQWKRGEEKRRKEEERALTRVKTLGRQQAAFAERQAGVLVCGGAPTTVSLEAIPPEFVTLRLRFSAFKRKVCRPFG